MKRIRFHIGSSIDSFPGNAIDLHLENPLRHIDHGPSSEDEDDADDAFSESNSKDIFPVVHPENPCYIADDISRHNDEKWPNCHRIESVFLDPALTLEDCLLVVLLQCIFESRLSREEVDHRRWEEDSHHGDHIDEIETLWEEEYPDEDEWSTRNEGESSKCWEEEIDEEERTPELLEKVLQGYSRERLSIIEVVSEYGHETHSPEYEDEPFNPDGEKFEH